MNNAEIISPDYWSNQTVLITGASRGIGRAMAIEFSRLGARVAINFNSQEAAALEVAELCDPQRTKIFRADVGEEFEVQEMFQKIEDSLGPVSILINNAGITRDGLLMMMSTEDWRTVIKTHVDGPFFCSRAAMRGMVSKKFGRILNIGSVSGLKGTPGQCNYSAAKSAIIGFTKALSREMGRKNITANVLALGVIETEMTESLSPEVLKNYKDQTSLKRFGTSSEVAKMATFLTGPEASYITGQVMTLDGGLV
jgi:3-oxoacyl-[acyl-carrier protein] reductase